MCNCSATIKALPITVDSVGAPTKLIGSAANGYTFAYAPTIIKVGSVYHKYFCSSGTSNVAWDVIRHATSVDLLNWSTPGQVIAPSDSVNERSCCDPSVVKFNAGDGEYYYLYYSGNKVNVQTVNFVARATNPVGPFAKYTERGTWEVDAPDPKIIQYPFNAAAEGSNVYGRGQPAVVSKGGLLYMWFSDTTENIQDWMYLVYMSTSTDGVNWQRPAPTGISSVSVDVKYDSTNKRFVMFAGEAHHGSRPRMTARVSSDGVHWCGPTVLFDMPPYSHNVGVSGGERGELQLDKMLFAYGAPVGLANNPSWAAWDLYGQLLDSAPGSGPAPRKISMAVASDSVTGLPASAVMDLSDANFYSSLPCPVAQVCRGIFLAVWFADGGVTIANIVLKARRAGSVICFPAKYKLFVTANDNSAWVDLGEFTNQPNAVGEAVIQIAPRQSYGIMIVPLVLTPDSYGNHYFQLSSIGAY